MSRRFRVYAPFIVVAAVALGAAMLTANPTGLEADIKDLGSSDAGVRKAVVTRLSSGSPDVKSSLFTELTRDHSALAKAEMAQVIKVIGVTSSDATALAACLDSADSAARQGAIAILGATGQGALAHTRLARIAQDDSESASLRAGAAVALGSAGPQGRSALKSLAADAKAPTGLRTAAMRGLASCSNAGADDVSGIAKNDKATEEDRRAAIRALAVPRSQGAHHLIGMTKSKLAWMRAAAADAIGSTKHVATAPNLVVLFLDPIADVRLRALRALIDVGGEVTHRTAIGALMNDADSRIQALAARSVGRTSADIAVQVRGRLLGLLGNASFRVRYEAAMALFAHGDKGGLATMQADAASVNQAQAQQAAFAASKIQGK